MAHSSQIPVVVGDPRQFTTKKRPLEDAAQGREGTKRVAEGAEVVYRLLAPLARTGGVIGKGGENVNAIRQETFAKVKVEDAVAGCEERVVTIHAPDNPGADQCAAQAAFFRVLQKVYEDDGPEGPVLPSSPVRVRLLLEQSQLDSLQSKGDLKFENSEEVETTLHQHDQSPPCARHDEFVLQVVGSYDSVWTILLLLTQRLRQVPPKPRASLAGDGGIGNGGSSMHPSFGKQKHFNGGTHSNTSSEYTGDVETQYRLLVPEAQVGGLIGKSGENIKKLRADTGARVKVHDTIQGCVERCVLCTSHEDASSLYVSAIEATILCVESLLLERERQHNTHHTVRMLVQANQIGAVLGKGGSIIKQIRGESGAQLVVLPREAVPPCGTPNDEVLQIEGNAGACMSASRKVLVALRGNMIRAQAQALDMSHGAYIGGMGGMPQSMDLALPPGIGSGFDAGLGMGLGPSMDMMFGASGAMGSGLMDSVQGVYAPPPDILGASMTGGPNFGTFSTPFPEPPPLPMQSNLSFQPTPPPPRAPLMTGFPQPQPPPPNFGPPGPSYGAPGGSGHQMMAPPAPPPPKPQQQQQQHGGGGGVPPAALVVAAAAPASRIFLQPAQVGAVLGKRGSNMQHLRMVSGARVKLHDNPTPNGERELEISGTPDQVANAQAIVQQMISGGRL